mgnify:CR=1 FL=1
MFEKIKKYYDRGFYTKEQVANFVKKGKLTAEQYKEITGYDYEG